jgi:hypothetical protein
MSVRHARRQVQAEFMRNYWTASSALQAAYGAIRNTCPCMVWCAALPSRFGRQCIVQFYSWRHTCRPSKTASGPFIEAEAYFCRKTTTHRAGEEANQLWLARNTIRAAYASPTPVEALLFSL